MDKKLTRRQIVRAAGASLVLSVSPLAWGKRAAPQFVAVRIWPANAYTRITLEASQRLSRAALEALGEKVLSRTR